MKKTFYFILSSAMIIAGCSKSETGFSNQDTKLVEISAEAEEINDNRPEVKTLINKNTGFFNWETTDVIGIECKDAGGNTSFVDFHNIGKNKFSGQISGTDILGKRAIYPVSAFKDFDGSNITLTLPQTYTYSEQPPLYLLASMKNNSSYSLKHLGGMMQFFFMGVPAEAKSLEFTADVKITGDFVINVSTDGIKEVATTGLSTTENKVTVTDLPAPGNFIVYVPVPTGTISSFTVALKDAGGNDIPGFVKTTATGKTFTIARAKMLVIPAIGFVPTSMPDTHAFVRLAEYNVGTTSGTFATSHQNDLQGKYNWADAKTACPAGYHLPSLAEVNEFIPAQKSPVRMAGSNTYKVGYKIINGFAFRYEWIGEAGVGMLNAHYKITGRNLGTSGLTIDDINNPSFWSGNKTYDVVRILPRNFNNGERAMYWLSTKAGTNPDLIVTPSPAYSDMYTQSPGGYLATSAYGARCISDLQ